MAVARPRSVVIERDVRMCGRTTVRGSESDNPGRASTALQSYGFKLPPAGDAPAPYYFDKLGRRWNFVREVTEFASSDVVVRTPKAGPSSAELDAMSDYEFADRMRGLTLHAGRYEYIQAEPDVERMREARALERARATLRAEQLPSGDYSPIIDSKGVAIPLLRAALGNNELETAAEPYPFRGQSSLGAAQPYTLLGSTESASFRTAADAGFRAAPDSSSGFGYDPSGIFTPIAQLGAGLRHPLI